MTHGNGCLLGARTALAISTLSLIVALSPDSGAASPTDSIATPVFQAPIGVPVGAGPLSITLARLDQNSTLDIVTGNAVDNSVSIALNLGGGRFGPASTMPVGLDPWCVVAGDLNEDGWSDLVVANHGVDIYWRPQTYTLSILIGRGDGTFAEGGELYACSCPQAVAIADLDADGHQDIVCSSGGGGYICSFASLQPSYESPFAGAVSTFAGRGDGTFGPRRDNVVGGDLIWVAVADLNGDSIPDAIATDSRLGRVWTFTGVGDGTFGAASLIAQGIHPVFVTPADLNQDGLQDLVIAEANICREWEGGLTILLGAGGGAFREPQTYPVVGHRWAACVGDFNGDGFPDVAAALERSGVSIYPGLGDGRLSQATDVAIDGRPYSLVVGDIDQDGRPDLAAAFYDRNAVSVLINAASYPSDRPAHAFLQGGARSIPIGSGPPYLRVQLEPLEAAYENYEVDWAGGVMRSEGTGEVGEIPALGAGKPVLEGDLDRDGVPDVSLRFGREELARLFSSVRGRVGVDVSIEAPLFGGGRIRAPLRLTLVGRGRGRGPLVAPNPMNPTARVYFTAEKEGPVSVHIFDSQGRMRRTLLDREPRPAGPQSVLFDGLDGQGLELPSGIYWYRVESAGGESSGKLAIVR